MNPIATLFLDSDGSFTVVTCPPPKNIERGYMSNNDQRDYDYMETIKYGCTSDYVLEGSQEIFCQRDGTWSARPSCMGRPACHFYFINMY